MLIWLGKLDENVQIRFKIQLIADIQLDVQLLQLLLLYDIIQGVPRTAD